MDFAYYGGAAASKVLVAEVHGENLCVRRAGRDLCEFRPAARGPAALWIERVWQLEAEPTFTEEAAAPEVRVDLAPYLPDVLYSMPRASFLGWTRS